MSKPTFKCESCGGDTLCCARNGYINLHWNGSEWEPEERFHLEDYADESDYYCADCGKKPDAATLMPFPDALPARETVLH